MKYKAEYADENFEMLFAENDREAFEEAQEYEKDHGTIFNIFEIDEDYDVVRTVL